MSTARHINTPKMAIHLLLSNADKNEKMWELQWKRRAHHQVCK